MNLSKSRYTRGLQCPKMLWMEQHMPEQFDDSAMNTAILARGNEVGDLAMGYYGDYVEVPYERDKRLMVQKTQELMDAGTPVICEASFAWKGNFCSADILRMAKDGADLVEVKSATRMRGYYYDDASYQTWVLEQCGLHVKSISLMHLNSDYRRDGALDLHSLFTVEDITEDVTERLPGVAAQAVALGRTADAEDEPQVEIGEQCLNPHACGYRGWCWRDLPEPNVLEVNNLRKRWKLFGEGIVTFEDLATSGEQLKRRQEEQVSAELDDLPGVLHADELRSWLGGLKGPLYFFDFETFQPAVPLFDGTKPYQQIPSQYSLHIVREFGATGAVHDDGEGASGPISGAIPMEHREFLGATGTDPRRAIAEAICHDIPMGSCSIAWNMSFERGCITKLAEAFPDLAEHLLSVRDGFVDLIVPFRAGMIYVREMGGSNSIKAVLPALFPDNPELDYHALDGVHNGGEASDAFETLADHSPEEQVEIRHNLLRYCRLDTLAMVRIWERLRELAER